MKTRLIMIVGALLVALLGSPAIAQPIPSGNAGNSPPGMMQDNRQNWARAPRDCSRSPHPSACTAQREARDKAFAACKDTAGRQRRQCMHAQMHDVNCARTANAERCAARQAAATACQEQSGPAFRQCLQGQMPPVDCRQAPNPQRCEQHQKARAACQDKLGPEHMACLRKQFGVN